MMRSIITISVLVMCTGFLHAQKKDRAQEEFDALRYQRAITLSLQQDTGQAIVAGRLANAYRLTKNYPKALHWYRKYMRMTSPGAKDYFNYASILANNEWYDSAQLAYEQYAALETRNKVEIDYHKVKQLLQDTIGYDLFYLSLNTNYDEFAPAFYKEGLVFTSNRDPDDLGKRSFGWDNKPFTDLWYVRSRKMLAHIPVDSTLYHTLAATFRKLDVQSTPATSNDTRTIANYSLPFLKDTARKNRAEKLHDRINSKYHDGPASLDAAGNFMAFTSNNTESATYATDQVKRLMIYTARYEKGHWGRKEPLPYNSNDHSKGDPALNASGDTLYFVSNQPGGYGGTDIYVTTWNGTAWTQPRNLGALVNTASDERFPSISADGVLYFSSDGHTGLGGLDIFRINIQNGKTQGEPKNMGRPFNSSKDDFGIIFNNASQTGYFSSNRLFSDDIYYFSKK